jgi:hypothetical protein
MLRQIGRRGDDHPPRLAQLARGQRAVRQRTEADRHIGLPARHIDQRVGQRDVHHDMRIERREIAKQRHHAEPPMRERGIDPQPPARRALIGDLLLGIVEIGQNAPRHLQIGLPLRRQRQRAGRAQQQPHAQSARCGRWRGSPPRAQAQQTARARKAALLHHGGEQAERMGAIIAAAQPCLIDHLCLQRKNPLRSW